MAEDPFGREQRHGWLSRLFKPHPRGPRRRLLHRTENLSFVVPEARATQVQAAIERWLAGHGIVTNISADAPSDGKVRLFAHIAGSDAAKLDVQSQAIQDEMQRVLTDALRDPGSSGRDTSDRSSLERGDPTSP
jgi:hypothetical protein